MTMNKTGDFVSIGDGVEIATLIDHLDRFSGILWRHECAEQDLMGAYLIFDLPWNRTEANAGHQKYKVENWEPLTLSPMIVCSRCGRAGWVRDGRWITDISEGKRVVEPVLTVPVQIMVAGEAPVFLGSFEVDPKSRTLVAEHRGLAKLLRAYADKLDDAYGSDRG